MRILHIDTGREFRGGQRQVLLLMRTLRSAGHESHLLARRESPLWQQAQASHLTIMPASLVSIWKHSPEYDVVHAHDARSHSMAALASRIPFVVSRRVAFLISMSFASRWKYRRPSRFLAVSNAVAQQLRSAGVRPERIDTVYDAIEPETPTTVWDPKGPVVAMESNDRQKGRDLVERAAEIARIPIVFSSNLSTDLQHASLFLYISRSEGFGSALLLAMTMGIPVIASRIDGLTEVFEEGVSGIAVDNDPVAIAGAIKQLIHQPSLAGPLIENARRRVTENFGADQMLARTLASYRRALAR